MAMVTMAGGLPLRDYQHEAIAAIEERRLAGIRRGLVTLPTGTGKTVVFSHLIAQRQLGWRGHAVVLVHRDELALQAKDKLQMIAPGLTVGIVKAEANEVGADTIVASVQTLAREKRRAQFLAAMEETGGVHTVVVDEAHHSEADTWREVLEGLGAWEEDGPLVLGFTATPERADGRPLGQTWEDVVYQRDILTMIEHGYLCDIRGLRLTLEGLDLDSVRRTHGDYAEGDLETALLGANAPERIVEGYAEYAAGRKTLVFTGTVRMAEEIGDAFVRAGYGAAAVSGAMALEERRARLRDFRDGSLQILANAMLLTEGYDEPSVDCVIVARPTRSHGLYVQQVGRGTRIYPGKSDLLVLDVVGATADHKLQTVVDLLGHERTGVVPSEGESILEAIERVEEEYLERQGALRAQVVDLFGKSAFRWVSLDGIGWALPLGPASLLIRRQGERFVLWEQSERDGPVEAVYSAPDIGYVQGYAHDLAMCSPWGKAARGDAAWNALPATDRQLEVLRRGKVRYGEQITRGEAAAMIDRWVAPRRWGAVARQMGWQA